MDKDRLKIKIKDIPYIYIDSDLFEGTLEEVSKKVLSLKDKLKESYKEIRIASTFDYDGNREYYLEVYRDETDEEYNKRIELAKKKSESAKLAAKNRKEAQKKRELSLLKTLKEKYERNG